MKYAILFLLVFTLLFTMTACSTSRVVDDIVEEDNGENTQDPEETPEEPEEEELVYYIDGATEIVIANPPTGTNEYEYDLRNKDDKLVEPDMWSVDYEDDKVKIDEDGTLTINSQALEGTFKVIALHKDEIFELEVTIVAE